MSEVCHDVCIEPPLQPLSGEHLSYATTNREDSVRLDIKACGFWGLWQQCAFFDVRVFNPTVPSCRGLQMAACYRRHEGKKCRYIHVRTTYPGGGTRIITPLVFSTSGGMRRAATVA